MRQRESKQKGSLPGTFGEGANQFSFATVHKVDPACRINDVEVMQDYSVTLSLEDVNYNQISQIRIFKMQLLERKDNRKWIVWTASGKVQESDLANSEEVAASSFQIKLFENYSRQDAQANFEKRFYEKTGNKWSERDYFKEKGGKYVLLDKEKKRQVLKEAQEKEKDLLAALTHSEQFECRLDKEVQGIVHTAFNFGDMKKYLSELGLDVDKLPIGMLTMAKVKRGHTLLNEIQKILVQDDGKKQHQTIVALTNDFYFVIPHNFGLQKPPVIDHLLRIKEKTRLLEQLQDVIELQSTYIRLLQFELLHLNPLQAFFNDMTVKLTSLEREDPFFQVINDAIENTQASTHRSQVGVQVRNVYSVYKPSEKLRFEPFERKIHNKFLLWHGVKTQALAVTLRNGIRMPNADSSMTGYMFGKGIYFTDCFSKAALQSLGPAKKIANTSHRSFILLSEVALGDMHRAYAPHQFKRSAPMFCHSVYGVGLQKPEQLGIKDLCQPAPQFLPS